MARTGSRVGTSLPLQRALSHSELAMMSAETPGPPPTSAMALPCAPTHTWTSSGLPGDTTPSASCEAKRSQALLRAAPCPASAPLGCKDVWVTGVRDGQGRKGYPHAQLLPCLSETPSSPPFFQDVPLPWPTHAWGSVTPSPLAKERGYLSLSWEILILPC